ELRAAHVDLVLRAVHQVPAAAGQDIGCILDRVAVEHGGAAQESRDPVVGNGEDRVIELLDAHARLETLRAAADRVAALQHDARLSVHVDERQDVAGKYQVGIADLRVRVPDLGPEPRLAQEHGGD